MAKLYTRSRSPYWWARFTLPNGEDIRRSTKIPKTEGLKRQAEIMANDWEVGAWKDWRPGSEKEQEYRFEELVQLYLAEQNPGSASLTNLIRLNEFFFGKTMNTLCADDIRSYKRLRGQTVFRGKVISGSTIRRELSTLSAMINYARIEWDWKLDNPVIGRKPPAGKGIIRWLTADQAKVMLIEARKKKHLAHTADFIELALNTGMRKMELLGLELSRIDLRHSVIHLSPEHQKNSTYSTIPLNQSAKKVILRRLTWIQEKCPNTRWLFPSKFSDGEEHITDIRNGFKAICESAGISNFRVHDLRHTFASWLVQRGVPIYEVKELLRHESISTTEKYAHLAPKDTAKHVDLINLTADPHTIRTLEDAREKQSFLVAVTD